MNRAVFDTNVLVSGFLSPHGPPGRIVEGLRAGNFQAVLDDRIFHEYAEVLARPNFGLPQSEIEIVLNVIREKAFHVESFSEACELPDKDDAPFLECAQAAEVPIVTGNLRHFPKSVCGEVKILTPTQFMALRKE
jgi:putative PIN family toxin of toxin-antitoxin system